MNIDDGECFWDLGLVTCLFNKETGTGTVSLLQTAKGFLYGFISSQMAKPALQYSHKNQESRYLQSGFNFTIA